MIMYLYPEYIKNSQSAMKKKQPKEMGEILSEYFIKRGHGWQGEYKLKPQRDTTSISEWLKWKRVTLSHVAKAMQKLGLSCAAGGNGKRDNLFGKKSGKVKQKSTMWASHFITRYLPKRSKSIYSCIDSFYSNFICMNFKLETSQFAHQQANE